MASEFAASSLSSTTRMRRDGAFALRECDRRFIVPIDQRQPDLERRTGTQAATRCGHASSVHFDQPLDHRQSDTEAALRTIERAIALHEQIEHLRQQILRDPDAIVGNRSTASAPSCLDSQVNLSVGIGVLGRVRQDVRHTLNQTRGVPVHAQRSVARDRNLVVPLLDERLDDLDRLRNHVGQLDRPALQLDAPLCDTGDVEQIIYQPRQVRDLTLDNVDGGLSVSSWPRRFAPAPRWRCGSVRAGFAVHARAWPGTRPSAGPPSAVAHGPEHARRCRGNSKRRHTFHPAVGCD